MKTTLNSVRLFLGLLFALCLTVLPARAATRVWDGGGATDLWGNGLNWIGNLAPLSGDSLTFNGLVPFVNTNDLGPGFDIGLITFSVAGYTVRATPTGNAIDLTNGLSVTHGAGLTGFEIPITNKAPTLFNVTQAGAALDLDGALELNLLTSTFDGSGNITVRGGISGLTAASSVIKNGAGTLLLRVDCTYEGPTIVNTGTLHVAAVIASPVTAHTNTTVMGEGRVNGLTCLGCTVAPGNGGPGQFTSDKDFEFNSTATLNMEINGTSPGSGHDQLVANADVLLGNATLAVTLTGGFVPVVGQSFLIVDNTGANLINGTFAGLPDGASFSVSNSTFRILYSAGDGNDVELILISIGATGVTRTWSGAGVNGFWNTAANWGGGVVPFPGDDLVFPSGALRLANTNNFPAGTTVNRIRVTGAGYNLFGNSLSLNAGVFASYAGSSAASFPITLAAAQSITNENATLVWNGNIALGSSALTFSSIGGNITVNSVISGSGTVRKVGPGGLIYGGAGANTYTTVTLVDNGSLILSKPAGVNAVRGNLTIGTAALGTPAVSLTASNQIFDGSTVIVNGAGTLDLGGFNEAFNTLSLTGAVVNTGSGLLTVTNRVNATSSGAAARINGHLAVRGGGLREFNIANGPVATDLLLNTDITTPDSTGIRKTGLGRLELIAASTGPSVVQIDAGDVFQNSTSSLVPITLNGGLLGGFGTAGAVTSAAGGTVAPGTSPGKLRISGGSWNPATTLAMELNGTTEGVDYDHLLSFGGLNLGGAALTASLGFTPVVGDTFRIIHCNTGSVSGQFAGLPEGTLLTNGFVVLQISYTNDPSAKDVTLRMVGLVGTGVTRTWDGAGIDFQWSNPTNWVGDVLPQPGDDLVFPAGAVGFSGENDFAAGTIFNTLRFEQGGYIMLGNEVRLLAGVTMSAPSGTDSVRFPVSLPVSQTFSNAGGGLLEFRGGIALGAQTLTVAGTSTTAFRPTSVLSGAGGLVKSGTSVLLLQGTNTFSGPVDILAGLVGVGNPDGLGSTASGTTVGAGATLRLENSITIAEPLSVAGTVSSISGSNRIQAPIVLTATNVTLGGAGSMTIDGPITETVPATLLVQGPGVVLNGTNHYTRTDAQASSTIINGFQPGNAVLLNGVKFGGRGVVGTMTSDVDSVSVAPGESPGILTSSNIFWNSFVTFRVEVAGSAPGSGHDQLVVHGAATVSGANLAVTNLTSLPPGTVLTILDNDGADAVGGIFSGRPEGSLLTNNGTIYRLSYVGGDGNDVTLTVPFFPTGITRVWSGGGAGAFWSEGANWIGGIGPGNGDALEFPGVAARFINTNDLAPDTAFASLRITAPGTDSYSLYGNGLRLFGDFVHAGTVPHALFLPVTQGAALALRNENGSILFLQSVWEAGVHGLDIATPNSSLTAIFAGAELRGSGPVTKSGSGILQLTTSNSFTGPLTIALGEVNMSHGFGLGAAGGGVTVQSGGRLSLNTIPTLAESALTFLDNSTFHVVNGTSSVPASVTLSGSVVLSVGSGRELQLTGPVGGSGELRPQGGGRVLLTGANSYSGTLRLDSGTTLVHGPSPAMAVLGFAGDFGGTGIVSTVQFNSGTFAPGASPGVLTTSNLFLNVSPSLSIELNGLTPGVDYDQVVVRGTVNLNGTLHVNAGFAPSVGTVFTIIDNDGIDAVLAPFSNVPEGQLINGGGNVWLQISYLGGDGNDVTLTAVFNPTGVARFWSGAGTSGFWSEGANWAGGVVPANGDDLIFPGGAARYNNTNDLAPDTAFASLRFTDNTTGYELLGNGLRLFGDLVHAGDVLHTVFLPVTQGAALALRNENGALLVLQSVWNTDTNALEITTMNGSSTAFFPGSELRGSGPVTKNGFGEVRFTTSNSFTGPLTIAAGGVSVEHGFGLGAVGGGVTVQALGQLLLNAVPTLAENALSFLDNSLFRVINGTSSVPASVSLAGSVALSLTSGRELRLTGPVSGTGVLTAQGGGRTILTGASSYGGTLQLNEGTTLVHGPSPAMAVVSLGGNFGGTGVVSTVLLHFGTLAPGASPGLLTTSNLFLNFNPTLAVELNGLTPGVDYDQVVVQGTVNLNGLLAISLGFTPPLGTVFTIIDNDGADAVIQPFRNLAEGAVTNVGGVDLRISYLGGDGNDVTLTVPGGSAPPSTIQFSGVNSNGLFTLTGAGISNAPYVLEATATLNPPIPWLPIATNNSDANGVYQFIDLVSTNFPIRFYRVLSP